MSVIRECLEIGVSPRCHLEDITRADIYGYVIPFCLELMKLMEEYQIPIKVRCCDTMGYGVNYAGCRDSAFRTGYHLRSDDHMPVFLLS